MILALDVGNTNITCGVFDGDRIKASFRITTKMPRTSDEYGMLLSTLLERNQVGMDDIHDAIICSVVPNIMHSLQNGLIKYFNIRPIIVEAGKGHHHQHAGGTCVWTDRTDRVHHQQGKGRNRHVRCKGCSDRRTRQNNIQ